MINCWINESRDLEGGEIIEINIGIVEESDNCYKKIRVVKYYRVKKGINVQTRDFGITMIATKQKFDPPIVGMVSKVNTMENNTTFILRKTRRGLPPFNTANKPLTKTFISSKIDELEEERKQASIGIFESGSEPICWENFPPKDRPAPEVMIDKLDSCHIYLGIFSSRYSEPTVKEYRRARELNIPILCFIKNIKTRDSKLEELVYEFKDKEKGITYKTFSTPVELKYMVKESVPEAIESLFE